MKKRVVYPLLLLIVCALCACSSSKVSPYANIPKPTAVITMENGLKIALTLDPASAPNTVSNFVNLANSGYYDGMKIDYVYPTYFLRTGDPEGDGTGGPDYTIEGEFAENGYSLNQLSHERGVISMCRLDDDYNSAGSQFFLMQSTRLEYDGKYAAFGWIEKTDLTSLHALDQLCGVTLDKSYRPLLRQTIASIRVDTKGYEYEVVKYGDEWKQTPEPAAEPTAEPATEPITVPNEIQEESYEQQ